jgi:hypothetical protein
VIEAAWMRLPSMQLLFIELLITEYLADQRVLLVEPRDVKVSGVHIPLVKPEISGLDLRFAVVNDHMAGFGTRTRQEHSGGNPRRNFSKNTH